LLNDGDTLLVIDPPCQSCGSYEEDQSDDYNALSAKWHWQAVCHLPAGRR
jgi:hypothetical protein